MARLAGSLEELLAADKAQHFTDFVELIVTDEVRPDHIFERLKAKYEAILSLRYASNGQNASYGTGAIQVNPNLTPAENTQQFIQRVTERSASEEEINLINSVLDEMKTV